MKLNAVHAIPLAVLTIGLGMAIAGPMNTAFAQQEQVYGRELMTDQERIELRERMRSATSEEERERIRWEHHVKMQERAKERGIVLPEQPRFGMRQRPGPSGGQGPLNPPKGGGSRRGG